MTDLQILNCDNCGACCMEMGSPPHVAYLSKPPISDEDREDFEAWESMPPEARDLIEDYLHRLDDDHSIQDGPCCWLDLQTMRCKFYEHRPSICRDFEVGSEGCRCWRDEFNIDVAKLGTMERGDGTQD